MVLNAWNIKIKEKNESNLPELKQIDSSFFHEFETKRSLEQHII